MLSISRAQDTYSQLDRALFMIEGQLESKSPVGANGANDPTDVQHRSEEVDVPDELRYSPSQVSAQAPPQLSQEVVTEPLEVVVPPPPPGSPIATAAVAALGPPGVSLSHSGRSPKNFDVQRGTRGSGDGGSSSNSRRPNELATAFLELTPPQRQEFLHLAGLPDATMTAMSQQLTALCSLLLPPQAAAESTTPSGDPATSRWRQQAMPPAQPAAAAGDSDMDQPRLLASIVPGQTPGTPKQAASTPNMRKALPSLTSPELQKRSLKE